MEKNRNIPSFELRTEKVQEILGHIPNWIVRWGMLAFFLVISLLIAGSYYFRYPHVVTARMKVTTENPPSNAIARTGGRIMHLFVTDNQPVEKDAVLAIIENTADFSDVMLLDSLLTITGQVMDTPDSLGNIFFPSSLKLDEIQSHYSVFLKNVEDIKNFLELNYHDLKVGSFENEIDRFNAYSWTLKKQSKILESERELAMNQFLRDSTLNRQGVIPQADFEKSKASLLQKQRAYEESRSALINNDIEVTRLKQQILDLKLQKNNEIGKLELALRESYGNLVAALAAWEQKFLLKTNVGGTVSFTRIWSENQNVSEGDLVMTVIPDKSGEIIGKLELQLKNSGKVMTGQNVNVKFDNFAYMEYGIVKARIKTISLVTNNDAYTVLVEFPEGLKTNYGSQISFSQGMQATAEIITNEESLLERIVNPVKSVLLRQKELRSRG